MYQWNDYDSDHDKRKTENASQQKNRRIFKKETVFSTKGKTLNLDISFNYDNILGEKLVLPARIFCDI